MRLDNQSTRWYLTIDAPAQIYTARLSAVPASTDQCASISYSSGAGVGGKTYADCLMDMTILVSAIGYGLYDLGEVRLRNTTGLGATSGTFNIGETSQIAWAANCYLTVIDEFALWPRHIKIASDGTTPLMDYDVPLAAGAANQNIASGAIPTPVLGPDAVLWKRGATVSFTPDASHSWVKDGTVVGWSWVCTGATVTNGTTATPTITFSSVGSYRLECSVTGDNGVSFTGYRRVFVVDDTHGVTTQFELSSPPTGDYNTGGWSARVTLYDEATLALVRDRAMVILHSVDYYGNTLGSIGYIPGCENIRLVGRIAGETITWGTEDKWGTVSFEIQGPQWWLGHMTAFPSGVIDTDTTPNKWTKFQGLTLNKALYHFMRWRSTATRCMDVYPNTDGRRHKRLEAPGGENIWAQLVEISTRSILAHPCCDRYGRFFDEIEQQLISDKSGIPVVQTITSADWIDEIRMDRVIVNNAALIDLSGISWNGAAATPYFSLAPGHVFRHYGSVEVVDRLMLTAVQADTNTLAGLYSAWKNNPYPKIDIHFGCNQHLIDIAPHQKLALSIAASDTPRGITESLTIIPRTIADDFDAELGAVLTASTFEAEVSAALAVTGDTPPTPPTPPPAPIDPPITPPPIDPPIATDATGVWFATATEIYWSGDYFNGGQPTWNKITSTPGTIVNFLVSQDGSVVYARSGSTWYRGTAMKTSPVWTDITTLDGLRSNYASIKAGVFIAAVSTDFASRLWKIGRYNGSAWTLGTQFYVSWFGADATGTDFAIFADQVFDYAGSHIENIPAGGGTGGLLGASGWTTASTKRIGWVSYSGNIYLRSFPGSNLLTYGAGTGPGDSSVRGSNQGNYVYAVDKAGVLHSSADGITFSTIATWLPGIVEDAVYQGGGSLVWIPKTVLANTVLSRLYSQTGAIIPDADGNGDRTGNFWSLATGDQTIVGSGLVYV